MKKQVITRTLEEVAERWIAALEGRLPGKKYRQEINALRGGNGYCCLGVACDLAARDGGDRWIKVEYGVENWEYQEKDVYLPVPIREFLKLTYADQKKLADLNDSDWSFADIAKVLKLFYAGWSMRKAVRLVAAEKSLRENLLVWLHEQEPVF